MTCDVKKKERKKKKKKKKKEVKMGLTDLHLSPPQRFDGALFVSAERSECRRKS